MSFFYENNQNLSKDHVFVWLLAENAADLHRLIAAIEASAATDQRIYIFKPDYKGHHRGVLFRVLLEGTRRIG